MTPTSNCKQIVKTIVKDIEKALNLNLLDDQIEAAYRVPSFNKTLTPALIIRFQSGTTRETFLNMYQQMRTLDAKEVNKANPSQQILSK